MITNAVLATWRWVAGPPELSSGRGPHSASTSQVVNRLRLLSEISRPSERQSERQVPLPEGEVPDSGLCVSVGPLSSVAEAENILKQVEPLGVSGRFERRSVVTGATHWVYLVPKKGRDGVRVKLAELRRRGIDSYLIPDGVLENHISLGVFSRLESAQARQRALLKEGVKAQVHSLEKTVDRWWLVLFSGGGHKIDKTALNELLKENNLPFEQENFCLDVASDQNFH